MLGGHGDELFSLSAPLRANFSSNVWHQPMPDAFYAHLREAVNRLGNYPAPIAEPLAELIARWHGLDATQVLVCNGATEAFYLIAQAHRGSTSLIAVPSFSEYEDACTVHTHKISYIEYSSLIAQSFDRMGLAWLCTPNNPDGTMLEMGFILQSARQHPQTVFVVDEAYSAFAPEAESVVSYIGQHPNLLVVKSLTKQFCIPGLRLGYVLGNTDLIARLRAVKMPWSVNSMAIAAGEYIFSNGCVHPGFIAADAMRASEQLQSRIDQLEGYSVVPSRCSYFLARCHRGTATELKEFLLHQHHLLIRDASNFRSLDAHCFRIAAQDKQKNDWLVDALDEFGR